MRSKHHTDRSMEWNGKLLDHQQPRQQVCVVGRCSRLSSPAATGGEARCLRPQPNAWLSASFPNPPRRSVWACSRLSPSFPFASDRLDGCGVDWGHQPRLLALPSSSASRSPSRATHTRSSSEQVVFFSPPAHTYPFNPSPHNGTHTALARLPVPIHTKEPW